MYPARYELPKDLKQIESLLSKGSFNFIGQAKTQQNSLFLYIVDNHKLVLTQYMPLPNFADLGSKG
jgi:hypothetical protein